VHNSSFAPAQSQGFYPRCQLYSLWSSWLLYWLLNLRTPDPLLWSYAWLILLHYGFRLHHSSLSWHSLYLLLALLCLSPHLALLSDLRWSCHPSFWHILNVSSNLWKSSVEV